MNVHRILLLVLFLIVSTALSYSTADAQGALQISIQTVARSPKLGSLYAWRQFQPGFNRKIVVTTPAPLLNGWDEISSVQHLMTPAEHLLVQAVAFRNGDAWTVLLVSGSVATFEKRAAAGGLISASLQPVGHVEESFAGRTAHHLTPQRIAQLLSS